MRNFILILSVLTLFSCTKKESKTIEPILTSSTSSVVNNTLRQIVDGNVITSHSYELKIYEDLGSGTFQLTTTNTYTANTFPYIFEDIIDNPFYFEITLHNNSTFTTSGNGVINADIYYQGNQILFLEADENTWSESYTSTIYNN